MCVTRQQVLFDGRVEGNTYSSIDIAKIASGFGSDDKLWCAKAVSPKELESHLNCYFRHHIYKTGVERSPQVIFTCQGCRTEPHRSRWQWCVEILHRPAMVHCRRRGADRGSGHRLPTWTKSVANATTSTQTRQRLVDSPECAPSVHHGCKSTSPKEAIAW